MVNSDIRRLVVGVLVAVGVIALLAWRRNDPGVGGREPDPPETSVVVPTTASSGGDAVVTTVASVPPTTSM